MDSASNYWVFSSLPRNPCLAAVLVVCSFSSACSPAAPAPQNAPVLVGLAPPSMNAPAGQALRLIVKFRQAVPYRDKTFLQDIGLKINAHITYLSSVSEDTHVYQAIPQRGQSSADILRSLSGIPLVLQVEADAGVRAF